MAMRTVRLSEEEEAILRQIRESTGLPISEALKRGLRVLQESILSQARPHPYAIFQKLDLGPGGYAAAARAKRNN